MAEIKNLKKAADRIKKAVKNQEKIILYGDADLDGVSSVIILKETILSLGGKISAIYFPDREKEGYGLNESALSSLRKYAPALLVILDCGIGNFKEIKSAKKIGFKTIIIDHHEILNKIPQADMVVDPKQKGDKYPFKKFATVGLAYKLSEIILGKKFFTALKENFLELTALATLADMMPREEENEIFILEGLSLIEKSWRPGIKSFFEIKYLDQFLTLEQKISKIISILNVRDVEKNFPASFRLFTMTSKEEAKNFIKKLIKKNELRKEKINETVEEIEKRILKNEDDIIFEGSFDFDFTLISPVASILCQRHKKPAFIFKKLKEESQGTVRVPAKINSVDLMGKCKDNLITYGGHPQASGFRVKNENLEKFKNCLIKHLKK